MTQITSRSTQPRQAAPSCSNPPRRRGPGRWGHRCAGMLVALALWVGVRPVAQAQTQGLERFGPIGVHGYPEWYQDKSGLALELLTPKSQAELTGGFDVLLPVNTTVGEAVGSTTNPWFLEHFYWLADAQFDMGGQRARLGLALEASFGNGFTVVNGDQVVFTRIRFDLSAAPLSGDYLILTPFSQHEVKGVVAGAKIRTVEDIGIAPAPAGFVGALNSKVGPFLTAALTPGGAELALTPGPAGDNTRFLASPLRVGPVTGSPLSPARNAVQVFFKASGATAYPVFGTPGVTWGTTDFLLYGRVHDQVIASRTTVDRVSKTALGGTDLRLDVHATAQPTLPVRVPPAAPSVKKVVTLKLLLPGSTTGATQTLTADGDYQWTQWVNTLTPANFAALTDVTLVDDNGIAITKKVADGLLWNSAAAQPVLWTPGSNVLKIKCVSSTGAMTALALPTVLRPNLLPYAGVSYNGAEIAVSGVFAPPSEIVVVSPGGGSDVVSVGVESVGGAVITPNRAPVAVADSATTAASTAVVINVLANDSDPDGDVLTVAAVTQPASGSVAITQSGTSVTYTPAAGTTSATFTYTVADGKGGTAIGAVSVTVAAAINRAPVAVADSATTAASTAVVINVLANDSDPDGDVLTVTAVTQPASGTVTITGAGQTVTYTPVAGTASAAFTYTVADGKGGTALGTVGVTVAAAINRPPVAVADSATTAASTAVVINVLANDSDPDGDVLTVTAVTQPASGSVTISGAGTSVTFTPVAGTTSAAFSYTVSDGKGGTAVGAVSVTVAAPANRVPVTVADVATTVGSTAVVINVLANDSDPDGDGLTVTAVTQPASGRVTITGTGKTVTYTPVAGASSAAPRTFTYTVSDGRGGTATGSVTVTVKDVVAITTADYTVRSSLWSLAGTAGFGATVTVTAGGTFIATATADARGAWTAKPTLTIPTTTTSIAVTSTQGGTATRTIVRK